MAEQMKNRVVITGIGVISSIGIGKEAFWDSLLKGRSGITPVESFDTSGHFTHMGGEVKQFDPEEFIPKERLNLMNRATQMALAATSLALEDADLTSSKLSGCRVGVSHGTTLGTLTTSEKINDLIVADEPPGYELFYQLPTHAASAMISRTFGLNGPSLMFSTACAAGNYAIAYGYDLIRLNRSDIVVAGASDPMSRLEYTGFNQFKAVAPQMCQPFDRNRKGMMLAEGAGILVLESLENALRRGAEVYAEVIGYGLSCDARHMTTPSVEGIAECMRKALQEAGISVEDVDYISAHGTGTRANDKNESAAIREVFGRLAKRIPVSSIKSMLGHTMGAASALEAIACTLAVKNDIIPPTINFETPDPECDIDCVPNQARRQTVNIVLNNSYAFGGNNASVVLKKFTK
ncbi:MAG: beta-ketoacyl-[acyl-carrier-protein] synthase family protein [Nitrospirae bacterium]|nr:beta-ketoacyl-[acyl-carrier-protein] synthase family protein [Nitrospirota bacterium]